MGCGFIALYSLGDVGVCRHHTVFFPPFSLRTVADDWAPTNCRSRPLQVEGFHLANSGGTPNQQAE